MGFLGVYRAIYDYVPQGAGELAITEGDILYILEKSVDDDWWRAKKKASEDDDDEPIGLIPNNYVEEAAPANHARALYDYTRQTDEELSFSEDAQLEVFDTSDPDWILVGFENEYGFAPANYIEMQDGEQGGEQAPPTPARPPAMPPRNVSQSYYEDEQEEPTAAPNPAAAIAGIMAGRRTEPPPPMMPARPQYTPEASDEEPATPTLPARPASQTIASPRSPPPGIVASPPHNRATFHQNDDELASRAPGGFRMYNINEMVSVMGKRKKMPTTLGINMATGTILIAPEKARDGPEQEWTADKMTHYSIEGKHVFLELIRPSKSVDFHAGSKDTAHEIDGALRDLAGAIKAEGLREVIEAATGSKQKKGVVVYDFMAQGDDEVSVAIDDDVIVLDDTKSEEWWQVRRLKNGKEGVVPSSYIEITGTVSAASQAGLNTGKSHVEQNRSEEERLAREALRASRDDSKTKEVGPGMRLPERGSSLLATDSGNSGGQSRNKNRESRATDSSSKSKSKPDPTKVRMWTDRSKSFSVEAQFLTLKDGKINLHKMNGVKIAVPVVKMSIEDLEYVERITGVSLDEDKPLSDIKGRSSRQSAATSSTSVGASIEQKPEYDWFPFFLMCDVAVGMCERYAQIFNKGAMDESVLPDVDAGVLRNLGIREGDIIKIMRHLDSKFGRKKKDIGASSEEDGSLFSGPGGSLKNNTRKGRPAPAVQTSDVVDAKAFSQQDEDASKKSGTTLMPSAAEIARAKRGLSAGFDDDAWDVKPAREASPAPLSVPAPVSRTQPPALTGSMRELSLLDIPLIPSKAEPPAAPPIIQQPPPQQPQQPQQSQQTGATPTFFGIGQQPTGLQPQQASNSFSQPQQYALQQNIARQRPAAPQFNQNGSTLMIPPPPRPLSAPNAPQQNGFGPPPLQPQMTGVPHTGFQSSIAPAGQNSLNEMNQMRMQQQYNQQQVQSQATGFGQQNGGMMQQPTGYTQFATQNGFGQMQTPQTGFGQSPVADPRGTQFSAIQSQPTGFQAQSQFGQQQFPQQTGLNSFLPPALQPQQTGAVQPQATGMNGYGQGFGQQQAPPIPAVPQQYITPAPLVPQKTGPPPPVRFGLTGDSKKLMPQATGRRANLAQATPQNPFGF